ncbi:hypothetical protein B1H58_20595 (plasmid) [Pantoea alhagi]|uniref:Uncharacterized protein n=1 Tax=Pantoea alhagi TaxID=1891675 RepID=A0A1W6BBF2_9GAMM|nr:hypothetical protein [Pantoea alhagi]ARJ44418.1 hypothetical protein B1H58_20595 [Pantoea alhagi]
MNDTGIKRQRGRPSTGNALSPAERARRYRENKKIREAEHPRPSRAELLAQLETAHNRIRQLESQLTSFVAPDNDSGKLWAIQDRKGSARWQTVKKGLAKAEAEKILDKLAASEGTGNYTYRMIEE